MYANNRYKTAEKLIKPECRRSDFLKWIETLAGFALTVLIVLALEML
jgi:hypothetical protein